MHLPYKTVLVTGGGTGIGLGIATSLAQNGYRVAIAGRRQEVLQQSATAIESDHPVLHHVVDVSDRESVNQLFDWAFDQWGTIDILVNSAGTNIKTRSMVEMTPDQWDRVLAVNATGIYNCMHAVLPQMRKRRDGLIINISSISGLRAYEIAGVAYVASKFAAASLGTMVANELGAEGVRVTTVYPGEVNTPILEARPQPVSDEHKASILQPEDVGQLVVTIAALPPRAHVCDVVIKPVHQTMV